MFILTSVCPSSFELCIYHSQPLVDGWPYLAEGQRGGATKNAEKYGNLLTCSIRRRVLHFLLPFGSHSCQDGVVPVQQFVGFSSETAGGKSRRCHTHSLLISSSLAPFPALPGARRHRPGLHQYRQLPVAGRPAGSARGCCRWRSTPRPCPP